MSLESFAHIAEIVGAVAVVVSMIYLALQVRQATDAQRTENYGRALERLSSMQAGFMQDPETASIFSKGAVDPESISSAERLRMTWGFYEAFGAFEFLFHASKTNSLPDDVWSRWSKGVEFWLSFPGVRSWWKARPIPFTDEFTNYVEDVLRDNEGVSAQTELHQAFVRDGHLPVRD